MIHIWTRATVDWEDEEAVLAQVPPRFKPRMELWNATISMPLHVFRHRVKEIAALNLSRVEHVVHSDWDDIPNGARVVPVDDDDWSAPNLAEVLDREWGSARRLLGAQLDRGAGGLRPSALPDPARADPLHPAALACETNNYALVKGPGTRALARATWRPPSGSTVPGRSR